MGEAARELLLIKKSEITLIEEIKKDNKKNIKNESMKIRKDNYIKMSELAEEAEMSLKKVEEGSKKVEECLAVSETEAKKERIYSIEAREIIELKSIKLKLIFE